jgi:hypothetical protein
LVEFMNSTIEFELIFGTFPTTRHPSAHELPSCAVQRSGGKSMSWWRGAGGDGRRAAER